MKNLRIFLLVAIALFAVSPLAAQNHEEHIFFQTGGGDIVENYYNGMGTAVTIDLTSSAGASSLPSEFVTPVSAYRISSVDYVAYLNGGDVHVLANNSGTITDYDRTSQTSAASAASNSQLTYFLNGSYPYVWYETSSGHLDVIWQDGGGFHATDLTSYTSAPTAVSGSALTAYAIGSDFFVDYLTSSGHVDTLYYDGSGWHYADLTSAASAPSAVTGSALTSDTVSGDHIYYEDSYGNVILLYYSSGWYYTNLTSATSAPAATGALTAFNNGSLAVCFVTGSNYLEELYQSGGTWYVTDLTSTVSAPYAAGLSLASAVISGGSTPYNTDVIVQELSAPGGVWDNWGLLFE
jgi:hypothetical protein